MSTITIITGPVASGKSQIADALARRNPSARVYHEWVPTAVAHCIRKGRDVIVTRVEPHFSVTVTELPKEAS